MKTSPAGATISTLLGMEMRKKRSLGGLRVLARRRCSPTRSELAPELGDGAGKRGIGRGDPDLEARLHELEAQGLPRVPLLYAGVGRELWLVRAKPAREGDARELGQYCIMYSVRLENILAASSAMRRVLSVFHMASALCGHPP